MIHPFANRRAVIAGESGSSAPVFLAAAGLVFQAVFPPPGFCQSGDAAAASERAGHRPPSQTGSQLRECRPGPWGRLEYFETFLEAPDRLVDSMPVPSRQTIWRFAGMSLEDVRNLFQRAGLSEDLRLELEEKAVWFVTGSSIQVLPSERVAVELLPDSRRQIYEVLGQWRENPFHRNPFLVDTGDAREWLGRSDLPPQAVDLVAAVSYPYGSETAFSDVALVLNQLHTRSQERRFLKAITRIRTLIVRIRLDGEQDLAEIAGFWSLGAQFKDSLPLLESVARHPQVDRLDIAHLLPPLPRKHLFAFPAHSAGYSGHYPGSFWTVFNFFEFWPDETPPDEAEIERRLQSDYETVSEPSRFGDAIVFRDPQTGRLLHACVFIADDIVYTKNGTSVFQPWILTKLPSLIQRWSRPHHPVIEFWRRTKIPQIEGLEPVFAEPEPASADSPEKE